MVAARHIPKQNIFEVDPNSWQQHAWRDKSPVMLETGSAGGGKSRLAAEKIHGYLLKYPGATGLMLRKTREATTNSIVLFMRHVVMRNNPGIRHIASARRFEYPNGSILVYGGMKDEQQREQIRSVGLEGGVDIAWMEEATQFSEQDFNELVARMRGQAAPWRQIILTTNPDAPTHWIYQRLILKKQASIHFSSATDNKYNPADYIAALQTLTGIQYERLVLGLWKQAQGVVYDAFDPIIHVLDELPKKVWRRAFASVDWGFTNPGVIQVWLMDNDDRMYLAREVYQTQQLDDWWVVQARQLKKEFQLEYFVCDPAEPAYIEKFNRAGLTAFPAMNDIAPGIQLVKRRLAKAGDGLPRIFFLKTACDTPDPELERLNRPASTLDEITAYAWPTGKDGKPMEEKPIKNNDHAMDTMRYAVAQIDALGEPKLRRL